MANKLIAKAVTNIDLANMVLKIYPSFKSHTASVTEKTFTEAGFEKMQNYDPTFKNDFFELSMRVWLNVVNISHSKDILAERDFGEYFDQPWGGIIQRMAVDSIKPISPAYKNLKNGDSPDPFVVRKPTTHERFFRQNFDYASLVTIPDDFQMKQIFISEFGMSEYMAGIMEGLQNGYTTQVYLNKLAALNAAINSTVTPLLPTQSVNVSISADPTDEELKAFLLSVMNVITAMTEMGPQTGAFNAGGFVSTQDKGRLRLLVRGGFQNELRVKTLLGAFNPDMLNTGVEIIPVPNFGGITYADSTGAALYPVYDSLGTQIGFNTTEGATEVTVTNSEAVAVDPNADVYAVLADKGVIFECRQNGYEVEPIRNPRGRYTNMWASSPNNTIAYDSLYNMVVFRKTANA